MYKLGKPQNTKKFPKTQQKHQANSVLQNFVGNFDFFAKNTPTQ